MSSTIIFKRKRQMLYVPLDFENDLTIDDLVDSGASVSAIAECGIEGIKQPPASTSLKLMTLQTFKHKWQLVCYKSP